MTDPQGMVVGERVAPSFDASAFLLAPFAGRKPPAPAWFDWAISQHPRMGAIEVAGAVVKTLAWGDPDAPGLLLMHGQSAHAGWWRHIAPFLADDRHVVALSWSGMGGSDWRPAYATATMQQEALAVAESSGMFRRGGRPALAAHSFGGLPLIALAARLGEQFERAVVIDTNMVPARRKERFPTAAHSSKVYPTLESALARFRFVRSSGCELAYVADLFAREGLTSVQGASRGWRWSFDPAGYDRTDIREVDGLIGSVRCPLALVYGADSVIVPPDARARARAAAPPRTRQVVIPGCGHHVMAEQPLALIAVLQALLNPAKREDIAA